MIEDYIAKAVADSTRPDSDRARDAVRKPAEILSFAGVMPGMTVAEWFPDGGYFTRMISRIAGPAGKVSAIEIKEFDHFDKQAVRDRDDVIVQRRRLGR
jgi:predicted methyltransferase